MSLRFHKQSDFNLIFHFYMIGNCINYNSRFFVKKDYKSFIKTVAISNRLSYNENTKGEQMFVCTMLQLNNPLKRN